jgi:hypothetical protein
VIALDPAMCLFDFPEFKDRIKACVDKPILLVRSESFDKKNPYYK